MHVFKGAPAMKNKHPQNCVPCIGNRIQFPASNLIDFSLRKLKSVEKNTVLITFIQIIV